MSAPIIPVVSSSDGPRVTVNELAKNPKVIPTTIIRMLDQGFLADALLRDAGRSESGVYRFDESTPLYADRELRIRAEGGEIPIAQHSRGVPQAVQSEERPLAMTVTDEDRRRNDMRNVQDKMTQVENTIVQGWDDAFVSYFLSHPRIPRYEVPTAWASDTADTRTDLLRAGQVITQASDQRGSRMNFRPNVVLMNDNTETDLMASRPFNQEQAVGNVADKNIRYTGLRPNKILQLNVVVSWRIPDGVVILMERGRCGFRGDELPLQATQLYRDEPRKTSRSDVERVTAMGIDQPKAACILEGA
jgi:hypothetical protein